MPSALPNCDHTNHITCWFLAELLLVASDFELIGDVPLLVLADAFDLRHHNFVLNRVLIAEFSNQIGGLIGHDAPDRHKVDTDSKSIVRLELEATFIIDHRGPARFFQSHGIPSNVEGDKIVAWKVVGEGNPRQLEITLNQPISGNVPLENIQWNVIAPSGFQLIDSDGNLELVGRSM